MKIRIKGKVAVISSLILAAVVLLAVSARTIVAHELSAMADYGSRECNESKQERVRIMPFHY